MPHTPDYVAEMALIEASRIQREAMELDLAAIDEYAEETDD